MEKGLLDVGSRVQAECYWNVSVVWWRRRHWRAGLVSAVLTARYGPEKESKQVSTPKGVVLKSGVHA